MMLAFSHDERIVLRILAAVCGTILLFSPWALGPASAAGAGWASAWTAGFAILAVGMAAAVNPKAWPDVASLVLGLWCLAAPRVLDFAGSPVAWSHVAVGSAVALLAAYGLREHLHRAEPRAA